MYMLGNTVGSAVPTPGGVGGIEAALIAVLTGAGVDDATAAAAVLVFRLGHLLAARHPRLHLPDAGPTPRPRLTWPITRFPLGFQGVDPQLLLVGLAGFLACLVDGALGMGFGPTASSILLGAGLSPAAASTTVNLAKVATGLAAAVSHWRFGNIDHKLVLRLAIPGMVGAVIGVTVLANVDGDTLRADPGRPAPGRRRPHPGPLQPSEAGHAPPTPVRTRPGTRTTRCRSGTAPGPRSRRRRAASPTG